MPVDSLENLDRSTKREAWLRLQSKREKIPETIPDGDEEFDVYDDAWDLPSHLTPPAEKRYSEDQPRDETGKWTAGGGSESWAKGIAQDLSAGKSPDITSDQLDTLLTGNWHDETAIDMSQLRVDGEKIFDRGNLGIPRSQMPQIPSAMREQFIKDVQAQGIDVHTERVDPLSLKPTQDEIALGGTASNYQRMDGTTPTDRYVIVSQDDHVIDGHHTWAATVAIALQDPSQQISVIRIGADAKDVLSMAAQWSADHGIANKSLGDFKRGLRYSPDQPRDSDGKWSGGVGDRIAPLSGGPSNDKIVSYDDEGRPIGKSGKPLATLSSDASMASLPEAKQQQAIDNLLKNGGITQQQATDHLVQIYDASPKEVRASSAAWYADAHALAEGNGSNYGINSGLKDENGNAITIPDSVINDAIKASGLTPTQMAGVIAALSPQQSWVSNMTGAYAVADITGNPDKVLSADDAKFLNGYNNPDTTQEFAEGMTYGDIVGGKYDPPNAPGAMASVLAVGMYRGANAASGYGNIEKAFAIANGADIDKTLGGPKVRSFFNNINNSGSGYDVTIDSHMVEAAVGGRGEGSESAMAALSDATNDKGAAAIKEWEDNGSKGARPRVATVGGAIITGSPSYAGATIASYPVLADATRTAAAYVNDRDGTAWTPAEFQAIVWKQQLSDYPDGVSGR